MKERGIDNKPRSHSCREGKQLSSIQGNLLQDEATWALRLKLRTWACVAVKHGSAPTITCLRIGQSCFILLVTISHLILFKVRKAVSIRVCIYNS